MEDCYGRRRVARQNSQRDGSKEDQRRSLILYHRKIIKITGEDSPNVRLAFAEIQAGKEPSHQTLVPGVLSYKEYLRRKKMWDEIRQKVGIYAEFHEGAGQLWFPPDWLIQSERVKVSVKNRHTRRRAMGIDCAEGGDNTSWAISDDLGLLELISMKTPDTSVIVPTTRALVEQYNVSPDDVLFDFGGGGKEHADVLRKSRGWEGVRVISFGAAPTDPAYYRKKSIQSRMMELETRLYYSNRRTEIYGITRNVLNPILRDEEEDIFHLPSKFLDQPRCDGLATLRSQMTPIPLTYGEKEGMLKLLPKTLPASKRGRHNASGQPQCLSDIIGCSPDELDGVCLSIYGLNVDPESRTSRRFI